MQKDLRRLNNRTLALTADLKTLNALANEMSSNLTQVTTMAEQSNANIFDLEFDKGRRWHSLLCASSPKSGKMGFSTVA